MTTTTKVLSKDDILAADDLQQEVVDVPEWGGAVIVRGLTGAGRDAYEASIVTMRGQQQSYNMANARAKLLVRCLVDEEGRRLFTESELEADALGAKSGRVLDRLFAVARRLSGLTTADMEELVGNSPAGQSGGSGSGSV